MKKKLLTFVLSVSIIFLTLSPILTTSDTENSSSFSSCFTASTSLSKYKLQIHVPAPSSDDYEEGT